VDLTLHVADENGFINLGGIVPPGAHYTATRNENTGVVRLVPVKVATTVVQTPAPVQTDDTTETQPWG